MTDWSELESEIGYWQEAGRRPRLWLRDDDAVAPTPALGSLLKITTMHAIPVLIAIIPSKAERALAARLAGEATVEAAVHGFVHVNHAPAGARKCELGDERPAEEVIAELRTGRERLAGLFPALSDLVVPPWNRISPSIARRVGEAGFAEVSTYGRKSLGSDVKQLNTHVDLIDWREQGRPRPLQEVVAAIARELALSRADNFAPVGVLSHHLRHPNGPDRVLSKLLEWTSRRGQDIEWRAARELFGDMSKGVRA